MPPPAQQQQQQQQQLKLFVEMTGRRVLMLVEQ